MGILKRIKRKEEKYENEGMKATKASTATYASFGFGLVFCHVLNCYRTRQSWRRKVI